MRIKKKTRPRKCKLASCSVKITKGMYCSRSCASKDKDFSGRAPTGFALLTTEQRAKLHKKRNKSEAYKATRTNSFGQINARKAVDEKYRAKIEKAAHQGQLAAIRESAK